jgi:8-oxo-dGTP pyrophosphatase MutT (NUDIX family)
VTDDDLTPAATVLLLRDGALGLEVLMLRRNSDIAFGGLWVFPGGAVDEHERLGDDHLGSARTAAVREVEEETGLIVDGAGLETWSLWEPPRRAYMSGRGETRRFSTWFFVAAAPEGEIAVDGGEIHEHRWLTPLDAIAKRDNGEINLVPPTWVTLWQLGRHSTLETAMALARASDPGEFRTRAVHRDPLTLAWAGDIAYEGAAIDENGSRNRLTINPDRWVYELSD